MTHPPGRISSGVLGDGKDRPEHGTTTGISVVIAIPVDELSPLEDDSPGEDNGLADISGDGGSGTFSGDA